MSKSKEFLRVYECDGFRYPSVFKCEIESSPKNIAAFIASAPYNKDYALYDKADYQVLTTMGKFADLIENPLLREQILKYLIPMQMGEAKIPKVKYKESVRNKGFDERGR